MSLTPDDIMRMQELRHADKEAKCSLVRELMVELRWDASAARDAVELWAMSPSDVEKLAVFAHSLIIAAMGDPRELRSIFISKLCYVAESALRKKKPFLDKTGAVVLAPDPDHKAAVAALDKAAKYAGLEEATPTDDYGTKSLDELMHIARRKLLPSAQPKGLINDKQSKFDSDEILTTGVPATGGARSSASSTADVQAPLLSFEEHPVPDTDSRRSNSTERVRGRGSRGDRDPTGRGRGRRPEGE